MQPLLKRVRREKIVSDADAERLLAEYERFLELKKAERDWNATLLSPSPLVDSVWHLHVLDTARYGLYCRKMCGRVIHHDPDGADKAVDREARYRRTLAAYERRYGAAAPDKFWPESLANVPANRKRIVTIRMLSGRDYELRADDRDSVQALKQSLASVSGYAVEQLRIIHAGRQLADKSFLGQYFEHCPGDVTVYCVLSMSGC